MFKFVGRSQEGTGSAPELETARRAPRQSTNELNANVGNDNTKPQPEPSANGLTIGLALGGGAARGWAHIGVLRALEDAGIRPHVVSGTSIGAVVCGCWAAGKLDALEAFARSLTKRRILGLLDPNFSGSGLINGNKLQRLLERDVGAISFDDLKTKTVFVATELGTGHEIWLASGEVVSAMRASYALPGIFSPVKMSERWLVDGALVNPVPVSVCRAYGARAVLAVNLNADVFGRGAVVPFLPESPGCEPEPFEPEQDAEGGVAQKAIRRFVRQQFFAARGASPGIPGVMVEAFNIIQDRITRSRLAGDPPDVIINPRVGRVGLFEFERAEEAIAIGYETTQRAIDEIMANMNAL